MRQELSFLTEFSIRSNLKGPADGMAGEEAAPKEGE